MSSRSYSTRHAAITPRRLSSTVSRSRPGYRIESVYEGGFAHGRIVLHRALAVDATRLAGQVRDARLAAVSPRDFVYVDTETTGLSAVCQTTHCAPSMRIESALSTTCER